MENLKTDPTLEEILTKDPFELLGENGKRYIKNLIDKYKIKEITIPSAVLFNPKFSHLEKLGYGILREVAKNEGVENVDVSDEDFREMLGNEKDGNPLQKLLEFLEREDAEVSSDLGKIEDKSRTFH